MAINLDALKAVLEPLLADRDDAAEVIESIVELDVADEGISPADLEAKLAEVRTENNARYMSTFFPKPDEVIVEQTTTSAEVTPDADGVTEPNPDITLTDLLKENDDD